MERMLQPGFCFCFFAFDAFLNVLCSWIVLLEAPNFCIVTDLRAVHPDILPRLNHLYWTHSHETNASRCLNVSKSSVLIYFSSFFHVRTFVCFY